MSKRVLLWNLNCFFPFIYFSQKFHSQWASIQTVSLIVRGKCQIGSEIWRWNFLPYLEKIALVIMDFMNFLTLAHTGNQRQSRIIVGSLPGMTQKSKYGSIHQAVRDVQVLSLHCEFVLIGRDQGASYKGGMPEYKRPYKPYWANDKFVYPNNLQNLSLEAPAREGCF